MKTNLRFTVNCASGGVFDVEILDNRPGMIVFKVSDDKGTFDDESGGHRFQRVPPTEKNGRVQTSTITVAVLPEVRECDLEINPSDLEWTMTISRGSGGQSVNTTYSCVVLKHKPTGLTVRCQNERSQFQNKRYALEALRSKLLMQQTDMELTERARDRKIQIGCGQRGDKRRTIRERDGQVKDHITGRTWRYADYIAGKW